MGDVVSIFEKGLQYVVISTHKEHKHFTTFGIFEDKARCDHFIESTGFPDEYEQKIAPLNIVWPNEDAEEDDDS
jgi:hypothetical protein